jgi:hypothetical protein
MVRLTCDIPASDRRCRPWRERDSQRATARKQGREKQRGDDDDLTQMMKETKQSQ